MAATKEQKLAKKLAEAGVTLTGEETLEQLVTLSEANLPQKKESTKAHIHNGSGNRVRTFSLEDHGEEFLELAKSYAKNPENEKSHGKMAVVEE